MEITSIKADSFGIHFYNKCHPEYTIMWWQIYQRGIDWWESFLSEKRWFTAKVRLAFRNRCESIEYSSEVEV